MSDQFRPMERLEELLGTRRTLEDYWNQLGWEFHTWPGTAERCLVVREYAECKAEGATAWFIEERGFSLDGMLGKVLFQVHSSGGGIHGVPWYERTLGPDLQGRGEPIETGEQVEKLAKRLLRDLEDAVRTHYYAPAWLDGMRRPYWTWVLQQKGEPTRLERQYYPEHLLGEVREEWERQGNPTPGDPFLFSLDLPPLEMEANRIIHRRVDQQYMDKKVAQWEALEESYRELIPHPRQIFTVVH